MSNTVRADDTLPLSKDQIRAKKLSYIKAINDNASIIASNGDDHDEHKIGNIHRDILESAYEHLDESLKDRYFQLRYSKPWAYIFGRDSKVDVHITFPDQNTISNKILQEIHAEQQFQFSKFKSKRSHSSISSLYTDYHNYKLALTHLGFLVSLDKGNKTILIQLEA